MTVSEIYVKDSFLSRRISFLSLFFGGVGASFFDKFSGFSNAYSSEWLLGAFEKLRKATMSFVMSVCLSVFPSLYLSICPCVRLPVRMTDLSVSLYTRCSY